MLLIGLWDFGCFFGMQAYQWMVRAAGNPTNLTFVTCVSFVNTSFPSGVDLPTKPSPAQFEVRFRTWQSLIVLDTSATLVSGLPLAIAEEDHACNLVLLEKRLKTLAEESERRRRGDSSPALDNDVDLKSMSPSDDNGLSASEWKRIFANVPGDSVFDVPSPVRPHPALFRARDPVFMRWKVEPAEWVREVPTHLLTSEFDQYYLVQLCFILRRICRLRQRSDMSNDFTDSAAAISVLPNLPDVTQLHDALIQFYHSLPEGERPFKSFDDIPSSSTISGSLPHPSSNSHASWIHRASAVTLQMYFFAGLALLHDVSKSDGKRMYRMGSATGKRLNSLEVLIQAQHAQVHVIRPAPSKTASDAANAIEAAMRTSQTSPPPEKNTWPLFGVSGKDTLGGKKPAQPSPSPPTPPLPLPREQLFSVENPPPPLPMVECPLAAFLIYANSLWVEMMRVWRVAEIYLVRLRQLFEEVTSHLESRMPAFSKRFDEICVETHVPGLREYMSEFYTIKSDSARRQRPYGVTAEDERYDDPLMSASTAWKIQTGPGLSPPRIVITRNDQWIILPTFLQVTIEISLIFC
ncbi:hypothetical protein BC829DRAFT_419158 [Chytridium lagenaria]|nr:hypothetical protein BC829DRAFT_419158 [Chytridium lagenaria]